MAHTLTTATTAVRDVLNEETAAFWSDTQIQNWIKEGCVDLTSRGMVYITQEEITLAATTLYYVSTDEAWIADAVKLFHGYYDDASNGYNGIVKIEPSQIGHMPQADAGVPEYFALVDKRVYIWPLTSAAVVAAGGKAKFEVAKVTDDITNIEFEFQHLPIEYAIAHALTRDKQFQEAGVYFSMYRTGLEFERQQKVDREKDAYSNFKTR